MSPRLTDDGYCCSLDTSALDNGDENRCAKKFNHHKKAHYSSLRRNFNFTIGQVALFTTMVFIPHYDSYLILT